MGAVGGIIVIDEALTAELVDRVLYGDAMITSTVNSNLQCKLTLFSSSLTSSDNHFHYISTKCT